MTASPTADRQETDALGSLLIAQEALYGIHSVRAQTNFPVSGLKIHECLYRAYAEVKLAAAITNQELGYLNSPIAEALIQALREMATGKWIEAFIVDPIQGGAGTSTNMAINEIAANRAAEILGKPKGGDAVDPIAHVNRHQSTNDTYPTAVKIAASHCLVQLETQVNHLLTALQEKEHEFQHVIKPGRTELMTAVPTTMGRTFSAFADAIARDRWRVFKCQERIRQVNLGGTAIGLGTAAPRMYIHKVTDQLRQLTGLPIARAENLVDATQNLDSLAEVFGMIKVLAINLEKISNDIRRMVLLGELIAAPVQAGSSIMPGKINPVMFEMMSVVAKKVMGNEHTAALAISQGELELNAFLPLIAQGLLESLTLLIDALPKFTQSGIALLTVNESVCQASLLASPASATLLIPVIGYHRATDVAQHMIDHQCDLATACTTMQAVTPDILHTLIQPQAICALGMPDT